MFSADLSWTEPDTEKIGERRERKAREQSTTAISITKSIDTSRSSRSSTSGERELWWASGLQKAKNLKPKMMRPASGRSGASSKTAHALPKKLDITLTRDFKLTQDYKDPTLQPEWTYSTTLSPTLPSGEHLDLPKYEVPELEGDTSSRRTKSTETRFSRQSSALTTSTTSIEFPEHQRADMKTPNTMYGVEVTSPRQQTSPGSFVTSRTRASSRATEREDYFTSGPDGEKEGKKRPPPVKIEGDLTLEPLVIQDANQETKSPEDLKRALVDNVASSQRFSCKPLSQWESLSPLQSPTQPVANAQCSTAELTRFQRFIRRMESAGPKIVLDRLKEEWQEPVGEGVDEELVLEKQLWLLTGFQMQNLSNSRVEPEPKCNTSRILELYGNLSEVYQNSAMHPSQTVHYLTTKPQRPIPLPSNVSYLTVREFGAVPLPYPKEYFSHIRASTLPSLVPSAKLPELFRECYKLLAPGGLLEIRIMDAAPIRKTAGPLMRMWIEDRLSVNLERLFRCSKPCSLVPGWLSDAGFELTTPENDQTVSLPCTYDTTATEVDNELSTIIGRELWKDIWGSFVDDVPDEPRWWWDDEDILEECLKRQTALDCRAIFAYKR